MRMTFGLVHHSYSLGQAFFTPWGYERISVTADESGWEKAAKTVTSNRLEHQHLLAAPVGHAVLLR